ncbi:SMODS domain-containing nucleotidyltransferase [Variovorax ginsengisoli]|uniref:Nucleotidyltransferase n=1 Tax=Variovorax ginsengisoli TaxID=363844 RepID=A0ABT8SD02_9BURK|nr:nucleotidyltransferase [Variovorax ginsengisoli]MDN8617143.1 nucleotidyltransferase [Variovorax ginsengisoli]MDO1536313.1 nucleotidyltransferase [Variovorax ginsengisoli]
MTAALFRKFRSNISVSNAGDISTSYASITTRLNKDFWDLESDSSHRRQVGSYGRGTAIHGISDLDMVFELPWETYERYRRYENNGPSQLLQAVRQSLRKRYSSTDIKGDGQVVVITFKNYVVEVLPAFRDVEADGYRFPDSNNGGSWKICKPVKEMEAVDARSVKTNRNYKHVCKMLRAWKNAHGVNMGGLLLDTLVYNFFSQTSTYDGATYASYDELMVSVFSYLGGLEHQDYWAAPGSGQRVYASGKFQSKAKKASVKCVEAKEADRESRKATLYREVFGRSFPATSETVVKAALESADRTRYTTEEFIEDKFPVDIRYDLDIDSEVMGSGIAADRLRRLAAVFPWLPVGRKLEFFVERCTVPKPYDLYWKVRNVGPEADRRGIRGQIYPDGGRERQQERTDFHGDHYVEAYVVKDDVCVARDVIDVRING